jgi:murein DD-endopeptidase MepM/ murein hydrolase activator NlpD
VHAAASGTVTFAGSVAGMLSVTVHHGGGVRTSYSYLSAISVASGARLGRGDVVGLSGTDHGSPAVHWSLRVEDRYLDPLGACRPLPAPGVAVRLAGVP